MMKRKSLTAAFLVLLTAALAFAQSGTVTFAVYGDSRDGHRVHGKIADLIVKARPDSVFHTGDMVRRGSEPKHWEKFNEITAQMRANSEFFPVLGNHDLGLDLFSRNFPGLQGRTWYSTRKGTVLFIVLDTNTSLRPGSPQYGWLVSQLESGAAGKPAFTVVIMHHPVLSTGQHPENVELGRALVPLLDMHNVDVVFSGHDHNYERSYRNGVHYIITGGGGAELRGRARSNPFSREFHMVHHFCLVSVSGEEMRIEVRDTGSRLVDSFVITARSK